PNFRRMAADLYNLAPQMVRSSYMDRNLTPPLEAACSADEAKSELRPSVAYRGTIARTYLYMHQSYPDHVPIAPALMNVLEKWNRSTPPDAAECKRAEAVAAIQGNVNSVTAKACSR
ncbi:MAG: endonuclease, partial [Myxococcota bacterium]